MTAIALYDQIQESVAAIRTKWPGQPKFGIILGTGLGGLREEIEAQAVLPYEAIPHFPKATAISHAGNLICGNWQGRAVVLMEGRLHYYEGYSMQQITFPVRVLRALGCEILIVTTACGGLNPQWRKGDLMLIEDHINLMGDNPLIGPNDDRLGPRFPDMCYAYDRELLSLAERVALEEQVRVHRGVYVALAGPNLETRAEYRFLRLIGADVVGMSTVPEVIVAVHGGLRVLGIAVITDMCLPDALQPVSVADILATAAQAEKPLRTVIRRVVAEA
jgi:purine-nucleoside phosphorylase